MCVCVCVCKYLYQAISHQGHQQSLVLLLPDERGVFCTVHACEVKHGHVWPVGMVMGKLQVRQAVAGGEISSFIRITPQSLLTNITRSQQLLSITEVLETEQ